MNEDGREGGGDTALRTVGTEVLQWEGLTEAKRCARERRVAVCR